MANFRQIHVKIWKDNWFLDLAPKEKLLYVYLFSNDLTSLSGIYQISQKVIAFETGLEYEWITRALKSFRAKGKLEYEDGYIWIKKLRKYHETKSPKVQTHIKNDLDNIPDIPLKAQYITHYQSGTPHEYLIDNQLQIEGKQEVDESESEIVAGKDKINYRLFTDELDSFRNHWKNLFPNKPQPRKKTISDRFKTRIKEKYFYDNWLKALGIAAKSNYLKGERWFTALWFLKNDTNWEKCLDGNYADSKTSQQANRKVIERVAQDYVNDES